MRERRFLSVTVSPEKMNSSATLFTALLGIHSFIANLTWNYNLIFLNYFKEQTKNGIKECLWLRLTVVLIIIPYDGFFICFLFSSYFCDHNVLLQPRGLHAQACVLFRSCVKLFKFECFWFGRGFGSNHALMVHCVNLWIVNQPLPHKDNVSETFDCLICIPDI